MTKRSTTDSTTKRTKLSPRVLSGLHETILSGANEAAAVTKEVAPVDENADAFQTTLPSNAHNGTIA